MALYSAGKEVMNRSEFMKQLERLLQNVSPTEREEALQYYNDYFDDAGPENEKEVIEALGNPAKVAESIKRDLTGSGDVRTKASDRALIEYGKAQNTSQNQTQTEGKTSKTGLPTWVIVLLVVLLVLASPAILGVGMGVLGVLVGVITAWFSMIFGFGVAALALLIVMFVMVVLGIICIFIDPLAGVSLVGGGLLCGGIGILFLMLTVAMGGMATPAICKGIAGLFEKKHAEGKEI